MTDKEKLSLLDDSCNDQNCVNGLPDPGIKASTAEMTSLNVHNYVCAATQLRKYPDRYV